VIRRILLTVSTLVVLALAAPPAGPAGAAPVGSPDAVAGTESATVGRKAEAALRASATAPTPGAGGSVSALAAWRIVTSPNKGAVDNHIHETSCVNNVKCVAVGYNEDPNGFRQSVVQALVNGQWRNQQIPHRGTASNTLWNVSCVVGNRCVAVGYYADVAAGYYRTLIANYSGGFWSLVTSPNKPNTDNYLFGVDCVDATHCTAVGRYYVTATGRFRTLILHLNGTTWQIANSPNRTTATRNNFLADVSCGDTTHCIAVGYSLTDLGVYETMILERINSTWSLRSSRNVAGAGASNLLRDVSCPTATECIAVGGTDPGAPNEQTFIQRLDGGSWAIETSPNRAATDNHLWGVSCPSADSCVAVGQSQNPTQSWTLVVTLAAGVWTQTPSPSRGATFNFQYGVSCPNVDHCVSGGDYINIGSQRYRSLLLTNS
jgi:hypothetical protein